MRAVQALQRLAVALLGETQKRQLAQRFRLEQPVLALAREGERALEMRVRERGLARLAVQDAVQLVHFAEARVRTQPAVDLERAVARFACTLIAPASQMQLCAVQLEQPQQRGVVQPVAQRERLVIARLGELPLAEIHARHAHVVERPRGTAQVAQPAIALQRGGVAGQRAAHVAPDVRERAEVLLDHCAQPHVAELVGDRTRLPVETLRLAQPPGPLLHDRQAVQRCRDVLTRAVGFGHGQTRLAELARDLEVPPLAVHRGDPAQQLGRTACVPFPREPAERLLVVGKGLVPCTGPLGCPRGLDELVEPRGPGGPAYCGGSVRAHARQFQASAYLEKWSSSAVTVLRTGSTVVGTGSALS